MTIASGHLADFRHVRASDPFDDDDEEKVFWEIEAGPGGTKTETFTAPSEAGTYAIVCGTPAHLEHGMSGTLIVK